MKQKNVRWFGIHLYLTTSLRQGRNYEEKLLLRATKGACNSNLQVVVTHASHVCSQHSFGLPIRMYGKHRKHFDHARLDLLSLVI